MTSSASKVQGSVRKGRQYTPAINLVIDGWDGGDLWGSAVAIAFALADIADVVGGEVQTQVMSALEYRHGAGGSHMAGLTLQDLASTLALDGTADVPDRLRDVSLDVAILAGAYLNWTVTDADLILGARVIARYLGLIREEHAY